MLQLRRFRLALPRFTRSIHQRSTPSRTCCATMIKPEPLCTAEFLEPNNSLRKRKNKVAFRVPCWGRVDGNNSFRRNGRVIAYWFSGTMWFLANQFDCAKKRAAVNIRGNIIFATLQYATRHQRWVLTNANHN